MNLTTEMGEQGNGTKITSAVQIRTQKKTMNLTVRIYLGVHGHDFRNECL